MSAGTIGCRGDVVIVKGYDIFVFKQGEFFEIIHQVFVERGRDVGHVLMEDTLPAGI